MVERYHDSQHTESAMPNIEITTTYDEARGLFGAVAKGFEYIRVYCDTPEEAMATLRQQIKGYHDENKRRRSQSARK